MSETRKEVENRFLGLINSVDSFCIYGASTYGKRFLKVLQKYGYEDKLDHFVVSDLSREDINSISEFEIKQFDGSTPKDTVYFIAILREDRRKVVEESLQNKGYNNIHCIIDFCELADDEDDLEIVKTKDFYNGFSKGGEFTGYDVVFEYAVVKAFTQNDRNEIISGMYEKVYKESMSSGKTAGKTDFLCKYWKKYEYEDYEIKTDENGILLSDKFRLALYVLYNISYMKIRKEKDTLSKADSRHDWLNKVGFNAAEKEYLETCRSEMEGIIEKTDYESIQSTIDYIRILHGNSEQFGTRGLFYQSLPVWGIKGRRPTDLRIREYGLDSIVAGKRVLDIGCNTGFLDIALTDKAKYITGIEYNQKLVDIANIVKDKMGLTNVTFAQGDFNKYVAPDKFDVIFSFAVHMWIGMDPDAYVEKLLGLLDEHGYIIFESQKWSLDEQAFNDHITSFKNHGGVVEKEEFINDEGVLLRKFAVIRI